MDHAPDGPRLRSDSASSSASQSSRSKAVLRQRLSQLMSCIEDMSSDDEADEEVSRSLDEAFQLCGRLVPTDAFRSTSAQSGVCGMMSQTMRLKLFRLKSDKSVRIRVCTLTVTLDWFPANLLDEELVD